MKTPLSQPLRLPVVAAPMFLISGPDLVIAACTSGIVGSFPAPNCRTADELDSWMGTITDGLTSAAAADPDAIVAPWAINLVTHRTNARLADDLQLVAQHQPPIVITALGSPAPVIDTVKAYGGIVIADVVNLKLAQKAAAMGVDGLACVSTGAGGHTGHLSPFAFISAVRDFFDGIITVGGGITDGQGIAGAVAAGADLVYMGTRFLPTTESLAQPEYKQMVVDHGTDDLIVSSGITGTDASWLRPSLVANGLDPDNLVAPTARNYDSTESPTKKWKDIWAAGQGLQTIRAIEPVAQVVDRLEVEYRAAHERFTALGLPSSTTVHA
ncbi:NAD(P)H-dependent flavin oxidoreductase [Aeromicrobium wangtongii]|uniref:Nitronate monooxygenase n=1 Tax=Aeromicrobium wangtongii TaxID=2969247 RepID=A0ABY5M7P8_9ACTN|nr:nitronate monooxygenase [Aeromicrobium wangtongii]MCD9199868.1 nitronate monooxygenase [Aeromicrobium wangtongii]UUP13487.1 nitronate monooxygenase [Aeromicrobium wangtongii]